MDKIVREDEAIVIKPNELLLPYGTKSGARGLSVGLSQETLDGIDVVLEGKKRLRSAWVERACQLLLGVQLGGKWMRKWRKWVGEERWERMKRRMK